MTESSLGMGGDLAPPQISPAALAAVCALILLLLIVATRGQSWPSFWSGIALALRGLLGKELRARSRGWRPALLLTSYLLGLGGAVVGFLYLVGQAAGTVPPTIGTQLFSALAVGAVLLLAFIAPALTAGAISGERERRTLDLLLVTRASPLGLVVGKLIASLVYALFLLVAALPAFALVYLYGGVPPRYLAMVMLVAIVTAVGHAALGLLLSAVFKRTLVALVLSYVVVLTLVVGLPFAAVVLGLARQMTPQSRSGPPGFGAPPAFLYASPLLSLGSVLPGGSGDSDLIGSALQSVLYRGAGPQPADLSFARRVYVVGFDPATGRPQTAAGWAPWVFHLLLDGAFAAVGVLVGAVALMPVKPWQRWRALRRARLAPSGSPAR
jgi:ABC-type transport system involved in multi-copper enzyme maturation permease subunit